ncbi:MAG: S41 family peptidase [Saprospiraceae bacterium]|nr:S41 family peptidase [Saprospiraceae bacterium]
MTKKIKILFLSIAMISGIAAVTVQNDKLFEISKNLEIFMNVYKELNTNFVDELDPGTMMRTAIDAMVGSLDPYTNFVSESQIESYRITQDEKYQGIGARVGIIDGKFTILEPYAGGPAVEAGLKAGDEIIKIDGVIIKGKNLDEINGILRGVPGTSVKMQINRVNNTPLDLSLTRGEVNIPNVPYSGMVSDNIGYISLTIFTQNAGANISKALKEMKKNNPDMAGVILDLRQNGGGLLHEAINICNIFVPAGLELVTTKGKIKERDQSFKSTNPPVDLDIPLAILIDNRSASASEIVSGAMQDLDRGVLIGQRSYGKGLVQNTKETGYNSRLKLTTSKYYIPSGRCIQGVEYENGEPKDIADEKRTPFKTRNGRTVLDGGGVTPDIKLDPVVLHPLTQALLNQYVVFNFVTEYISGKDSIMSAEMYRFTDFDQFTAYVKKTGFKFESEGEKQLLKVKEDLAKLIDLSSINSELKAIDEKISEAKQKAWVTAKEEISKEISKEIVTRYYFQGGKTQHTLATDNEIKEAIALLNDSARYRKILGKK